VIPATEPTDIGHRQAYAYQLGCIRLMELLEEYTYKDNVKKQGMRKHR